MKKVLTIFFLLIVSHHLSAQENEYTIIITDKENDVLPILNWLSIDDSLNLIPINLLDIQDSIIYNTNLTEGQHRLHANIADYNILDTTIFFSKEKPIVSLSIDMKNDFYLHEFKEGFCKIYTGGREGAVVGLREDSTFLFKRFIHHSYAAWFQLEQGKYTIEDSRLTLKVYESSTQSTENPTRVSYNYYFQLKDDKIIDIDKYGNKTGGHYRMKLKKH